MKRCLYQSESSCYSDCWHCTKTGEISPKCDDYCVLFTEYTPFRAWRLKNKRATVEDAFNAGQMVERERIKKLL